MVHALFETNLTPHFCSAMSVEWMNAFQSVMEIIFFLCAALTSYFKHIEIMSIIHDLYSLANCEWYYNMLDMCYI